MRVVVALGGNALLRRGQAPDASVQQDNIRDAVRSLALLAADHEVVVTHGNGPQVGLLALESEADPSLQRPYPLDVLGAETEGMLGYWLAREIGNALPGREVVAVLTQTLVDLSDPGFLDPSKPVGPVYDERTARDLARSRGWHVRPDGASWRRVVPSPAPLGFVELRAVRRLVDAGVLVVCAGGGGVPVARTDGGLVGVEAVVDKDSAAALLAQALDADALLLLTDVPALELDHGTENARAVSSLTVTEAHALPLAAGSMGPKVAAACRFVERTGGRAGIGALTDALAVLTGDAGTTITP